MASLVKVWTVRYFDEEGRRVPKDTPGAKKIRERSKVWYGQYKEAGRYKRVPLYTDKTASNVALSDIVRRIERGEAGLENPHRDALGLPIEKHIQDYLARLRTEGTSDKHLSERERILRVVLGPHRFDLPGGKAVELPAVRTLAELTADRVETYITHQLKMIQVKKGQVGGVPQVAASARTKDTHRGAVHAFCEWLATTKPPRIPENPVRGTAKPKGEVMRPRRAETAENLKRLLKAAKERPLLEALTVRKGPRAGEQYAKVRPEIRAQLLREGRERALLYKTAILTGMRQGELALLLVRHLRLDGDAPAVYVAPRHNAKNKVPIWLPLIPDHAAELAAWVKETNKTPGDTVFYVPEKPNKIFRRDLRLAGIDYRDKLSGDYFDFHSLRHCTDTYLNAAGVPPSVVMLFMRHRTLKLSIITYNDPRMTDARKALDALPKLD